MTLAEVVGNSFMYFAYGSNLLTRRIHINNPTAIRKSIGQLKDHRLDFASFANRWNGPPATVVPEVNKSVWGAIWEINLSNMAALDKQEGVEANQYKPLSVPIETPAGEIIICRMYQLVKNPTNIFNNASEIPIERKPSLTYIKTIIEGAVESGLPETYISFLNKIPDNGRITTDTNLAKTLNLEKSDKDKE